MIVIGIIGILSTIGIGAFSQAQRSARDAKRRADLKSIQAALEAYAAQNNNLYPIAGYWGNCPSGGYRNFKEPNPYIPGLVPQYISILPKDPRQGGGFNCYLYVSDGYDYKIMAHGTVETGSPPEDSPFKDWRGNTYSLSTPGGANW